jgi:hypothetical protein
MAYAAIIGAVVQIGMDIYGQASKKNPLADYPEWLKGNAQRYIQPFTNANYWNVNVPAMAAQSLDFGLVNAPAINQSNMAQLQGMMDQAMPNWRSMFGTMQDNTNSLLAGTIPQDVQDQIQRNAALSSVTGGTSGAGTGMTHTVTARDLGLTSLQLQQQGQTQGMNLMNFARQYLMPQQVNPTSLLPISDLLSGAEYSKNATFQANEAMYTAMGNVAAAKFGQPQQSLLGGMGGDIGALIAALGKKDSSGNSGMSGIMGMLGGMFGGGSGGGGGGGFDASTGSDAGLTGFIGSSGVAAAY